MASRKKGSTRVVEPGETVVVAPGKKTTVKLTKKRDDRRSIPMAPKDRAVVAVAANDAGRALKVADAAAKTAGDAQKKAEEAKTMLETGIKSIKESSDNAALASVEAAGKAADAKTIADEAKKSAEGAVNIAKAAVAGVKTEVATAVDALKAVLLKKVEDEVAKFDGRVKEAEEAAGVAKTTADTAKTTADEALEKAKEALNRKSGVSLETVIIVATIFMLVGVVATYFLAMGLNSGQKADPALQTKLDEANGKIADLQKQVDDFKKAQVPPYDESALRGEVVLLQRTVKELEARPDQRAEVTALKERIAHLEKGLRLFIKERLAIIGHDSPDGTRVNFTFMPSGDGWSDTWEVKK